MFIISVGVMCVVCFFFFVEFVDIGFVKIEKGLLGEMVCDFCWFFDCFYVG